MKTFGIYQIRDALRLTPAQYELAEQLRGAAYDSLSEAATWTTLLFRAGCYDHVVYLDAADAEAALLCTSVDPSEDLGLPRPSGLGDIVSRPGYFSWVSLAESLLHVGLVCRCHRWMLDDDAACPVCDKAYP